MNPLREVRQHISNDQNIIIDLVYEDDNFSVYKSVLADTPASPYAVTDIVPHHVCYSTEGRIDYPDDGLPLKSRNGNPAFRSGFPWAWAIPKNPHREEEVILISSFGCNTHGNYLAITASDAVIVPVSAYQLRKDRPELEKLFTVEVLQDMFTEMPLLSCNIALDDVPGALQATLDRFSTDIKTDLSNKVYAGYFGNLQNTVSQYFIVNGNQEGLSYRVGRSLSDHMLINGIELVDTIVAGLDLELFECYEKRVTYIIGCVTNWIQQSQFARITRKILKDQTDIYLVLTIRNFSDMIITRLDDIVKETK